MDLRKLKTLIELVESSGIAELEIAEGEERVRITRTLPASAQQFVMHGGPQSSAPVLASAAAAALPAATAAEAAAAAAAAAAAEGHVVKSPMVGTFYRAPEPGAESYAQVGTRVTPGQTVCIIEAMKIMNEIEAEIAGVVREVCVEDAQPVEYGQVLFRVDPNG